MSMTYASLTDQVIDNLEISSTDLDKYKVPYHINQAQLKLLNIVDFKWLDNAIKTVLFNLAAHTFRYQWPNDFLRYYKLWLSYSSQLSSISAGIEAIPYDMELHMEPMGAVSSENFPMVDIDTEGGFEIAPTPTVTQTNGGRLRYIQKLPTISAAQDCLLHPRFESLLIHNATAMSAAVDNYRPDLAKFHQAEFDREIKPYLPKDVLGVKKP